MGLPWHSPLPFSIAQRNPRSVAWKRQHQQEQEQKGYTRWGFSSSCLGCRFSFSCNKTPLKEFFWTQHGQHVLNWEICWDAYNNKPTFHPFAVSYRPRINFKKYQEGFLPRFILVQWFTDWRVSLTYKRSIYYCSGLLREDKGCFMIFIWYMKISQSRL